jgi:ubiquinone biosynthesis protein
VVVEGVARSLDPHINIWQVAKPIVEDYVRQNLGPKALLRDLGKTVRVLSRFGPKLPLIAENLLIRQTQEPTQAAQKRSVDWLVPMGVGAALVVLGMVLAKVIGL